MSIDRARIAEIRALFERATPGPWEVWDGCSWRRIGRVRHQGERPIIEPYVCRDGHPDLIGQNSQHDLKFMASSWQSVFDLLSFIDQQATPPPATEIETLEGVVMTILAEQAQDEGLWFQPQTVGEDLLQRALRRLHEAIEGKTSEECARAALASKEG